MTNMDEFRKEAEKLADLEHTILLGEKSNKSSMTDMKNIPAAGKQTFMILLIAAAVTLVISLIPPIHGGIRVICFLAALICFFTLLLKINTYVYGKKLSNMISAGVQEVNGLQQQRLAQIDRLNELRAGIPELSEKTFWWDQGIIPASQDPGPGTAPADELTTVSGFSLSYYYSGDEGGKRKAGVVLDDIFGNFRDITREQAEMLLNSSSFAVIYADAKEKQAPSASYTVYYLADLDIDPIPEISKSTTYYSWDINGMRNDFSGKLLDADILAYDLISKASPESAASLAGEWAFMRDKLSDKFEASLRQLPDSDDYFKKTFNYLYKLDYAAGAVVLASGDTPAYVLIPRFSVPQSTVYFRAPDENTFGGTVVSYLNREPYSVQENHWLPSFRSVVDAVFSDDMREIFEFNERDVLADKPENIPWQDWCYLIWADRKISQ